jgi:hypothetical protein
MDPNELLDLETKGPGRDPGPLQAIFPFYAALADSA